MSRDMPAGYNPKLDTELPADPTFNASFNDPPSVGGPGASDHLDAQLFGDTPKNAKMQEASKDFGGAMNWPGEGRSIFSAAMSVEQQRMREAAHRGDDIPAYAKQLLQEAEAEDDEELDVNDSDADDSPGDDGGDIDDDVDFDFGGTDFEDDESDSDGATDSDEFDELDDIELDDEDAAQTQRWKEEDDVEEEMAKILGDDSPYVQGTDTSTFDPYSSTTYANAKSDSGFVDEDLTSAATFRSGGFLEEFDDGFVFVSGEGHTLAFAKPDAPANAAELNSPDRATKTQAALLIRTADAQDEEEETYIDLAGEEIDAIVAALKQFQTGTAGIGGIMERARRRTKGRK